MIETKDLQRFAKKVMPDNRWRCWEWDSAKDKQGYGQFTIGNKTKAAHRIAYSLFNGKLLSKEQVRHKCDNPSCVNPFHLTKGSAKDNARDRDLRGLQKHPTGEKRHTSKLSDKDVDLIRQFAERHPPTKNSYSIHSGGQRFLARWFNTTQGHVSGLQNMHNHARATR